MTQATDYVNAERLEDAPDASVGAGISQQLKKFYGSIQEEGIPDRLIALLEKLDEAERNMKRDTSAGERVL